MRIGRAARLICFFYVWALAFHAFGQATAPVSTNQSRLLITVLDRNGEPTPNIAKDMIGLKIDGRPTEIQQIRPLGQQPLIFSLLLDASRSTIPFGEKQVAAASNLFRALSTGENRGYLILFAGEVRTSEHPLTAEAAEKVFDKLLSVPRQGSTSLYDALCHASDKQVGPTAAPGEFRRAIIVISDGEDNSSHHNLDATLRDVQSEGVPIISIGFSRDDSNSPRLHRAAVRTFESLSEGTGGLVGFLEDKDSLIDKLPVLLGAQYELDFKAEGLSAKKSHSARLTTNNKDLQILAQREIVEP